MPEASSVREAIDLIRNGFDPEKVAGVIGVIQFELSGEESSKWALKLDDGTLDIIEGGVDDPTSTILMSADDFVSLIKGQLNAVAAFMTGKIKVQGDMNLVMKLQTILGA
jgi:putative sterol carrier protein